MISHLIIKYVSLQNRIVAQSIFSHHIKVTPEIFDVMPILSKAVDSVDRQMQRDGSKPHICQR